MDLAALVPRLAGHRVLVVGDLVLDEYLTGVPVRLSREAPVPVLEEAGREYRAGSAGSPAANVVALGSTASLVGAVGGDAAGECICESLAALGIHCDGLVHTSGHTATKTRILAQGYTGGLHGRQQLLRVDRTAPITPETRAACVDWVTRLGPAHDALLLSDYRGGVVEDETIAAARATGRPIAVDSQGDLRRFRGVDLVKVNEAEARAALGHPDVRSGGEALRQELEAGALVITLGAEGMALFSEDGSEVVPAVRATEVFDVTGAGDTVIAVLTLALVAGFPLRAAAGLANAAASVVVRRLGVATVTPRELVEALGRA